MKDTYEAAAVLITRDGELTQISRVVGVDFGRPIKIIKNEGDYAVAKCEGHLTWSGIGRRRWAGTEYYLLRIWRRDNNVDFQILEQQRPGMAYQSAIKDLMEKMEKLVRENE